MTRLNSTQKKSFAAAVILVVGVVASYVLGLNIVPTEAITNQNITNMLIDAPRPTSVVPEGKTATIGLRHTVSTELQEAYVISVVDGDTLRVQVAGEYSYKYVRLIGINAPESVASDARQNTREGRLAADHMRNIVVPGTMVYLQKDTSEVDAHDRLLRYVWLAKPINFTDPQELKAKMLNATMLADGYAMPHKFRPDDAYFDMFRVIQLDAFHDGRGLWEKGSGWSLAV